MSSTEGDPPDLDALSAWAPELARAFVTLASDIALVIDSDGTIREIAQGRTEPIVAAQSDWLGRRWVDVVTDESRGKVEKLLNEVASAGVARRRELNHQRESGQGVPVAYTAIRLGQNGPVLAVGRDLRAVAAIQQRFVESQQEMERGYWKTRQAATRNRLLSQVATDAIVVVDAQDMKILEVNDAAVQLFGLPGERQIGQSAHDVFEERSRPAIGELLLSARSTGYSNEIGARLAGSMASVSVTATSFRAERSMRLLLRARVVDEAPDRATVNSTLARLFVDATDAVVVTDSSGRVLVANESFVKLVGLDSQTQVIGQPLADWLGSMARPLSSLLTRARSEGLVRRAIMDLRSAPGVPTVQVSAALLTEGDQACFGFTMPAAIATPAHPAETMKVLTAQLERIAELLSQGLTSSLAQATGLVERHLAELAMQKCLGDTTAAAALLKIEPARLIATLRDADQPTG